MKNLKKVLALALAVIMMMSLFTVAFAAETETKLVASDFTDYAEIEYKDAVALCVDLGIISGISNGDGTYKFAPKDNIDRASWAKLVYFIATGDDNADAFKGANVGMNDISTSWAEGFIAYCVANGYAAGDGLGNYLPANNMTVAAGLKTLLNVLGWDPDDRGYQGTLAWSGNVMTDAKKEGLMKNVDKANTANVNLTREVAAQIIYNALQAEVVTPIWGRDNGEKFVSSYDHTTDTLSEVKFNVICVETKITAIDADGVADFEATYLNGYGITAAPALLNETVKVFYNSDTGKPVTTYVSTAANDAALTFTDGLTKAESLFDADKAKANDEKGKYVGTKDDDFKYYVDGDEETLNDSDSIDAGDEVNVYTNDDGKVYMVKVTTWTTAKISADPSTKVKSEETYVKVPGISDLASYTVKASAVNGWEDLEKGDIVRFNKDETGIFTIVKAEKVTGSVSKKTASKITIDGTAYAASADVYGSGTANKAGKLDIAAWDVKDNKSNTYDFYLDLNGDICYVELIEGEVETEVAYVLDSAWVTGTGIAGANYGEAKLLFTDGTTEIVTVAKYSADNETFAKATSSDMNTIKNQFVTYSINSDGKYEVCLTEDTDDDYADGTVADDAAIVSKVVFTTGSTANNDTVFFVEKYDATDDESTYSIYTGYKNVPELTNASVVDGGTTVMVTDNGVALYVYLRTETGFSGETPEGYVYVADEDDYYVGEDGLKIQTLYNAEGEEIEMTLASGQSVSTGTFYTVASTNEENGNTLSSVSTFTDSVTAMGNGVVTIGSVTASYDDETVFVVVDLAIDGSFDSCYAFDAEDFSIDTGDDFDSVTGSFADGSIANGDVADFVYVVRTAKA